MLRNFLTGAVVVLGAVTSALGQTTVVKDTFTAGANTLLEAHTPDVGGAWTRQIGASGITINAAADNARNTAAGDWNIYTNASVPTSSEVVVGATVTFTNANANNWVDLVARGSLSLVNGYIARVRAANDGTGTNVQILRVLGGALTVIASASKAISLNVAHSFIFSVKDASKEIWIDGVLATSTTDNTVATAGLAGIGMDSSNAAQTIADNFFVSTFAPTAVRMRSMSATHDAGKTVIEWSTGSESQNLGFRVWRESNGKKELLTPSIVAGSAFLVAGGELGSGNTYRWLDRLPGGVYWIEEIDLHGKREWHGPIAAAAGKVDESGALTPPSPTLAQLSQRVSAAAPRTRALAANGEGSGRRRVAGSPSSAAIEQQYELAAARSIKISVVARGLQRVARQELLNAGLDPAADPKTIRVYEDGVEIPIIVNDDGSIEFYGTPLDTPSTGTRVYWLVAGNGVGLRMPAISGVDPIRGAPPSFDAVVERRDKLIYFAALLNGDEDSFFGPVISSDPSQPTFYGLTLHNVDPSGNAAVDVTLQGASDYGPPHRVSVTLNGHALGELNFAGMEHPSTRFDVPASWLREGNNDVLLASMNGADDISLIDSVRITYPHTYAADDDQLTMTVPAGDSVQVTGFTSPDVHVVDVTDPHTAMRIPVSVTSGAISFVARGSGTRTIIATGTGHLLHPARVEANEPSSLHDAPGADIVMITHRNFAAALEPLRQLRESQGHSVIIANVDDVYDEFNFGAKDPAAIRAFLARTRSWHTPAHYVLLVGDASYDERVRLGQGDFDFVPTKLINAGLLKTASDSWLADFDADGVADLAIGRLPVRTLDEANIEVGKTLAYENAVPGLPWTKNVVLVSDVDPQIRFDETTDSVRAVVPPSMNIEDVDVGALGVVGARATLLRQLDEGALLVNYVGHGSVEIWTSHGLFQRTDAASLTNGERLPVVVAMTCLNGYFQDVVQESLAEGLLKAPNGGAVAVWASSALTDPNLQSGADQSLIAALLQTDLSLGDATLAAERAAQDPNVRQTFILFGDPALHLRRN